MYSFNAQAVKSKVDPVERKAFRCLGITWRCLAIVYYAAAAARATEKRAREKYLFLHALTPAPTTKQMYHHSLCVCAGLLFSVEGNCCVHC